MHSQTLINLKSNQLHSGLSFLFNVVKLYLNNVMIPFKINVYRPMLGYVDLEVGENTRTKTGVAGYVISVISVIG